MNNKLKNIIKKIIGQKNIDRMVSRRNEDKDLLSLNLDERKLIKNIKHKNLTYLSNQKLSSITATCKSLEEKNKDGLFIEAGCALGGSTILITSIKSKSRPLLVYDVFGMIPPPTQDDTDDVHARYKDIVDGKSTGLGGDKYYGYEENLYEKVQSNLREFGIDIDNQSVSLIKGLVQDTLEIDKPVAFAHIDVDWYQPVMTCLERIFPHLIIGGSIILDDYHDWGGCKKATDEYLKNIKGQYELNDTAGSMKITRIH